MSVRSVGGAGEERAGGDVVPFAVAVRLESVDCPFRSVSAASAALSCDTTLPSVAVPVAKVTGLLLRSLLAVVMVTVLALVLLMLPVLVEMDMAEGKSVAALAAT